MDTVLELRALRKDFPTHRAVDGISLHLSRGEFYSLIGPSGCGKTTTLRLIAGLEIPTSGDILLDGASIINLKPYQRDVTTVFQNYALFPHLTVGQNIAFGLERRGLSKPVISSKVAESLALVELQGKEERLPNQISGGERQRVALARSLVLEPKVLLLDEPLSALDPKLRRQMRRELKDIQRRVGITFLFITHDQEEALSMSDQIAVINRGRIEQVGSPRDVYRRPAPNSSPNFWATSIGSTASACGPKRFASRASAPPVLRTPLSPLSKQPISSEIVFTCEPALHDGAPCIAELSQNGCDFQSGEQVHVWWHPDDELRLEPV